MFKALCVAVCLLGLLITASNAQAGDENVKDTTLHSWAIQFGFSNLYSSSAYDGKSIYIKKEISKKTAWRLDVTPRIDMSQDKDSHEIELDSAGTIIDAYTTNSAGPDVYDWGLELDLYFLKGINQVESVQGYIGIGPMFSYDYWKHKYNDFNYGDRITIMAGITTVFGFDYRFKKKYGLFAEYSLKCYYEKDSQTRVQRVTRVEETEYSKSTYTTESFKLHGSNVVMGFILYF